MMKKTVIGMMFLMGLIVPASAMRAEYSQNTVICNGTLGIGTFSAGEHDGGSVFVGGSVSTDWIPNEKTGLLFGIETGLLCGETQNTAIFGIPIIFRLGWQPDCLKSEKIDIFILAKIGWSFGIWGAELEKDATSNGIVGGFNFGGRHFLTPSFGLYAELGYNYYGLARSDEHPEYPLGYGSGKFYVSFGVSLKPSKN